MRWKTKFQGSFPYTGIPTLNQTSEYLNQLSANGIQLYHLLIKRKVFDFIMYSKGCKLGGICDYDAPLDNCDKICNVSQYQKCLYLYCIHFAHFFNEIDK